jgi:ATP synthase protein I
LSPDPQDERRRQFRQMGRLISLGWEFALAILVGLGLGILMDRWLPTRPWGTFIMTLFGIAAGFVNFFRTVLGDGGRGRGGVSGD